LDDIRARTRTSKSQLFHYFPDGREQLLLAVARYEADRVLADQQPQLGHLTSWDAWLAWRDAVIARYREQGQQCPLSALVTQLGRATPGAQAVVTELMARWQAEIAAGVRYMQAAGEISADLDPARTAAAIVAATQGGVVMLMSTGDTSPLEAALDLAIGYLRASSPALGTSSPAPHTSSPALGTSSPALGTSSPALGTSSPAPHTSSPAPHTSSPAPHTRHFTK